MKTTILLIALVAGTLPGFSQGVVLYYNRVAGEVIAPVYGPEPAIKTGNTSDGVPAGTQVYLGARLEGTGYSAGLWAGPEGATLEQLAFVPGSLRTFRTGITFAGAIDNSGGVIVIPGVSEGSRANLMLRAWDNQGGTITSWDQFVFSGRGHHGDSKIFTSLPLGNAGNPVFMTGLESFNVWVPEPSTYALAGVGTIALWLMRRRSSSNRAQTFAPQKK